MDTHLWTGHPAGESAALGDPPQVPRLTRVVGPIAGLVVLIDGLVFGASLLYLPGEWIAVCAAFMLGAVVLTSVALQLHREPR